jgi:hypothetical protein
MFYSLLSYGPKTNDVPINKHIMDILFIYKILEILPSYISFIAI